MSAAASRKARCWWRAVRPHHWAKNVLVFVPAVAGHELADKGVVAGSVLAFVAFSLVASAAYLINDLADLEADRAHPTKRRRPFASGELQAAEGRSGAIVLVVAAFSASYFWSGPLLMAVLGAYFAATILYSFGIKRRAATDVLWLAGLYTLRVVTGSAATGIEPSFWLLAFSMFLFLSLAAAKRAVELSSLESHSKSATPGRGYTVADLPLLLAFGVAAAYSSVQVLALYVHSRAELFYTRPAFLWLLCPILLYWVSRIWLKAHRRQLHEDPVVYALTDRPSLLAGVLAVGLLILAN